MEITRQMTDSVRPTERMSESHKDITALRYILLLYECFS